MSYHSVHNEFIDDKDSFAKVSWETDAFSNDIIPK
jgi:hypothetical protein